MSNYPLGTTNVLRCLNRRLSGSLWTRSLTFVVSASPSVVCHVELTSGFNTSAVKEQKVAHTTWTLYGIFQLSDHLSCSDGETPSHNECGKSCTGEFGVGLSDSTQCPWVNSPRTAQEQFYRRQLNTATNELRVFVNVTPAGDTCVKVKTVRDLFPCLRRLPRQRHKQWHHVFGEHDRPHVSSLPNRRVSGSFLCPGG